MRKTGIAESTSSTLCFLFVYFIIIFGFFMLVLKHFVPTSGKCANRLLVFALFPENIINLTAQKYMIVTYLCPSSFIIFFSVFLVHCVFNCKRILWMLWLVCLSWKLLRSYIKLKDRKELKEILEDIIEQFKYKSMFELNRTNLLWLCDVIFLENNTELKHYFVWSNHIRCLFFYPFIWIVMVKSWF